MIATFPFLIHWGAAKPWQKCIEFLMSFPIDNEKIGVFSLPGMIVVMLLNGLLWGTALFGLINISMLLKDVLFKPLL